MNKPLIALKELQQARILVEELGLLREFPQELIQLSSQVKRIISSSRAVKGVCAGDYYSLIMLTAIYWGIVKTFPRTVIKNVKKFLNRFSETNDPNNSSRNLLFLFNFTGTQREKILASLQYGVSGIAKDYGLEEGSHLDYWKKLMVSLGIMLDSNTNRLSHEGAVLINKIEQVEPIIGMDAFINKETDMRNALIGMLAVEFLAVGASESIIDSPGSHKIFAPSGRGIPRTWFDVHYHAGDQYILQKTNSDFALEFGKLQLPHDTISFNMLKLAHIADYKGEELLKPLEERVLAIAKMFAAAGNYIYEVDEPIKKLAKL